MTYNFDPNGALDTGDELTLVTNQIRGALDDLSGKVAAFVAANNGLSIENYQDAQKKWNQGAGDMHDALYNGVQALNTIHDQYVLADNQGAALFGGDV